MINTFVGNLGHLMTIVAFVSALVSAFAYYRYFQANEIDKASWRRFSRISFYIHAISTTMIALSLFEIIYNHRYEYFYAYSHSSKALPVHYMISSFWEGQEGAFILWAFWNVALGVILIHTNKYWEAPVMVVFALVQAFLVSMIMGVVIGDLKIGSSPFILLRDATQAPIFNLNPDFVPEDGTGLNPLLQNIWMVIHPPTLFLGYASTLVPFAFLIGGLVTKKYAEWIRPALPWAIFSAMILGMGIIMGAYWAYVTLNFGGYWNWDPVENAVYVPWLILVASIHTMITFKKSATALKTSIVLVILSFILVLYATFLVRSGVLGDASVHSFTDLGLSGQLLLYMLFFMGIAIFLAARAWKHIPSSEKEASVYSREFWIFLGAVTLGLMSFQVILPTSIPAWNALVESFGGILYQISALVCRSHCFAYGGGSVFLVAKDG
jgi:cytochrome c-type biogenesis protein CcmF